MKMIQYRIELLEPALVTSLEGDPNSSVAFDYVPGSVLRGIFIGKYLGSKRSDAKKSESASDDAKDDTFRRLFLDGTTRYLNGYPLDRYGRQGLPVSSPFYTLPADREVRLIRPLRNVAVHTQRTARFGRAVREKAAGDNSQTNKKAFKLEPDEIPGTVYRYDALAAGQTFEAAIICDHDDDEQALLGFINGHVTLGGSRSGGYGRAKISLVTDSHSDWDPSGDADDLPPGKLVVTLQSAVLLRDERGQFAVDPNLLGRVLSKHLQVEELKLESAFLGAETIGGFNRKWGLPLPQTLAARMGSVLVFTDPGCTPALLRTLEARGIGERRAEGFGRLVFNRQRAATLTVEGPLAEHHRPVVSSISDPAARQLAILMVNRMLRQRLDRRLLAAASAVTIDNPPSNAQISRLRGVVLEALRQETPDTAKIGQFIQGIQERSSARRQFERSTVDKKPLRDWLKHLLRYESGGAWTMDDNEWQGFLHVNGDELRIKIADVTADLDNRLRLEYILRLVDLVLAQTVKRRGKED
jgi:CRISPR-associated protein Csx10